MKTVKRTGNTDRSSFCRGSWHQL